MALFYTFANFSAVWIKRRQLDSLTYFFPPSFVLSHVTQPLENSFVPGKRRRVEKVDNILVSFVKMVLPLWTPGMVRGCPEVLRPHFESCSRVFLEAWTGSLSFLFFSYRFLLQGMWIGATSSSPQVSLLARQQHTHTNSRLWFSFLNWTFVSP